MDQFDGNYEDFTDQGSRAADASASLRFYTKPFLDNGKSAEAGRPIYKDVDYIEIRHPGRRDSFSDVYRPHKHASRFGRQYEHWKSTQEQPEDVGTHLSMWGGVSASQVKELEHFNVRTVEQLAAMADIEASKFMNGQTLKRKANEYIENNKGAAHVAEVKAELAAKDDAIAEMKAQMAEMKAQMEQMNKPKRGRPRKDAEEV